MSTAADATDPSGGRLSLREAIAQANAAAGADEVLFAGGLAASTLHLTQGQLAIDTGGSVAAGDGEGGDVRVVPL